MLRFLTHATLQIPGISQVIEFIEYLIPRFTTTTKFWTYLRYPTNGDWRGTLRYAAGKQYSLIGTARLNNLDPQAYLHYVIERIADHPINRVDELLPWHVADVLPSRNETQLAA
jgi:hypothetical protein